MGNDHDYLALDWVKGEIEETLKQARQSLESFVSNPEDSTRMRFCLTYLHQVYGTLQMVEFYGAALLAEEMEQLAQAILNGAVARADDAEEVLMRSILQLPVYLDKVRSARRDLPVVILPLLNDLRATRGESLLSETALFAPNLESGKEIATRQLNVSERINNPSQLLRRYRQMYQISLVGLIRGNDLVTNLGNLAKVLAKMEGLAGNSKSSQLWWIGGAIAEGLANNSVETSTSVKMLLGLVDRQIKLAIDTDGSSLAEDVPEELIKNLLYYVAKSDAQSPRVKAVKEAYNLDEAIISYDGDDGDQQLLAGPDREAMESVVAAISEEINAVKEVLDIFVRRKDKNFGELSQLIPTIKQISDTLAVLGLGVQRRVVREQIDEVEWCVANQDNSAVDTRLLDVAGALLYVEATLSGWTEDLVVKTAEPVELKSGVVISPEQLGKAQSAVMRECRVGLESAKEAVVEFIVSQWDHDHLDTVPELLNSVQGGLLMIPLIRPARLIENCIRYVQEELLGERTVPDWKQMDILADAITSVEYYLERLSEDSHTDDYILDIGEEGIGQLGYPVTPEESESTEGDQSDAVMGQEDISNDDLAIDGDSNSDGSSNSKSDNDSGSHAELEEEIPILGSTPFDESEPEQGNVIVADNVVTVDFQVEDDSFSDIEPHENERAETERAEEVIDSSEEDDLIDDEIIEIFVEEVGEVLDAIKGVFPRWENDFKDEEALTEIRRAFHTLKGSGRLVGAVDAGELSWSIENMLNRIIDGTISPSAGIILLVSKVVDVIPSLVDAFENRKPCPYDLSTYQAAAEAFSEGEFPDIAGLSLVEATGEATVEATVEAANNADKEALAEERNAVEEDSSEDDTVDPVLLEIFAGEAKTHLESLKANLVQYDGSSDELVELDDVVLRALHTLKGSAYMANMLSIAEVASPTEQFVKELAANNRKIKFDVINLLHRAVENIDCSVNKLVAGEEIDDEDNEPYLKLLAEIKAHYLGDLVDAGAPSSESKEDDLASSFLTEGMDIILEAEELITQWNEDWINSNAEKLANIFQQLEKKADAANLPYAENLCRQLSDTCLAVIEGRAEVGEPFFDACLQSHEALVAMMDRLAMGQFIQPADEYIASLQALICDAEVIELDDEVTEDFVAIIGESSDGEDVLDLADLEAEIGSAESNEVEVEIEAVSHGADADEIEEIEVEIDGSASTEYLEETDQADAVDTDESEGELKEIDVPLDQDDFDESFQSPSVAVPEVILPEIIPPTLAPPQLGEALECDPELLEIFLEEANETLGDSAIALERWMAEPSNLADVEQLQRDLHTLKGGARMAEIREIGDLAHYLENLYEGVVENRLQADDNLFDLLYRCHDSLAVMVEDITKDGRCLDGNALIEQIKTFALSDEEKEFSASTSSVSEATADASAELVFDKSELEGADDEIVSLFVEEAEELLEGMENATAKWRDDIDNEHHGHELQRLLHTLKGGARLAGLKHLGNSAHECETFLIENQLQQGSIGDPFFTRVTQYSDSIANYVEQLKSSTRDAPTQSPALAFQSTLKEADAAEMIRAASKAQGQVKERPEVAQSNASQEVVRVASDLLENLVNLAGETSISRARVEKEVTDFTFTLEEMGTTIERLKEQMRRFNIETETQIMHRHEAMEGVAYDDFDPLEMDRYSQLNQLSKSMAESAGDISDLRETLLNKTRNTETLLIQQGRINTELQEGLMRTRLVPFSRLVPRLRRIVRQIGSELGKSVDLEIINAEGEMDRAVLERMVSPLEHMLRNAVDHGIENTETRLANSKAETGRITLHLVREGAEIVLRLSDDGGGIDVGEVRNKAIEKGLMRSDAHLTESETMQFIFQPGFSTAEKITQVSGRGVGMDVVHSEIKQLGGSLKIHSALGVGTQFTVRLPFTVAVNRALMVKVGEESYAVPLSHIEGIVRVSPYELETYYEPESTGTFEYADQSYRLQYLGGYVRNHAVPNLTGLTRPLPVLLVRGTDYSVALQVDSIVGSREIVVKSVGSQLSGVSGISGATILGDGSVVIILDLLALIRSDLAERLQELEQDSDAIAAIDAEEAHTVMVVDDSVTVRKVTSRVLERHGFDVLLAKDGVDAITLLQEHIPSIILLDIEMPRMDGFEVASLLRHDERLKHIPIIMITSRTGQKHRERAISLGVNEYLGKPFQEIELLQCIGELISNKQ